MKTQDTPFRTIVDVPKWTDPMQKGQQFVLLGSCFAQNMGELFQSYGLNVVCNPLGVTYNPESIRIQVEKALEKVKNEGQGAGGKEQEDCSGCWYSLAPCPSPPAPLSSLFFFDGLWRSWWAGTRISDADEGRFRETIQVAFRELGEAIRKADWLFLTLGTNVCYRLKENGMTVANCHKVPAANFDEVSLDLETCTKTLCSLVELLREECPHLQIVFTVSPYRYKKYGFHGSQLAKATLLLAVDKLCKLFPKSVRYFPAYELLLDELRDYRFYADDMIHPAPMAVNYIWKRLTESCMDEEMRRYLHDYEPIRRAKKHVAHILPSESHGIAEEGNT